MGERNMLLVVWMAVFGLVLPFTFPPLTASEECACICEEKADGLHAHCQDLQLRSVCHACGPDVTWLDLSGNLITVFNLTDFAFLPNLTFLNLSRNQIDEIKVYLKEQGVSSVTATDHDDDNNESNFVPPLLHLSSLDLSHNGLSNVTGASFAMMPHLRLLVLEYNKIEHLSPAAFQGLAQLETLRMCCNSLALNESAYPKEVFRPLRNLTYLSLHSNIEYLSITGMYPDAFCFLSELRYLDVDTAFNITFGSCFRNLSKLEILDLSRSEPTSCLLTYVTKETFFGFRNSSLKKLILDNCKIRFLNNESFIFLPELRVLSMRNLDMTQSVRQPYEALYGLMSQNMSLIDFTGISTILERSQQQSVSQTDFTDDFTVYLANICVSNFSIQNNHIAVLVYNTYSFPNSRFSSCIRHFNIANNQILYYYDKQWALSLFNLWPALQSLDIQCQSKDQRENRCRKPQSYVTGVQVTGEALKAPDNAHEGAMIHDTYSASKGTLPHTLQYLNMADVEKESSLADHPTRTSALAQSQEDNLGESSRPNRTLRNTQPQMCSRNASDFVSVWLAPSLEVLNMSYADWGMTPYHANINFTGRLRVLDLAYTGMSNLSGTLLGLDLLHELRMNGDLQTAGTCLFSAMPRLEKLHLPESNVSSEWLALRGGEVLGQLTRLTLLDLSSNALRHFPSEILRHLPALRHLQLHDNQLPGLTRDVTGMLDNRNISLSMRGNPIRCTCESLEFVGWLGATSVDLDDGGDYTCLTESGMTSTGAILQHGLQRHWLNCYGQRTFTVAVLLWLVVMVALMAAAVASRHGTYLRYLLRVLRSMTLPTHADFRKDVYVGHADADWQLACVTLTQCLQHRRGVRLLLRLEEEIPGSLRAENVLRHIDESWKILLLVTQAFTVDPWAAFTVLAAEQSITDRLPHRVVVVFVDPQFLPAMASLECLLRVVPERQIFHITRNTPPESEAWDRLARAILDTD